MGNFVYHYSTSSHLPYILREGVLKPGRNRIGGYPIDFLWATTNDKGSRSSTGYKTWREQKSNNLRLVRFTLPAHAFEDWPAMLARHPEWTTEQVARLEAAAHKIGDEEIASWRCREKPLGLDAVPRIDTRSYAGKWTHLEDLMVIDFDEMLGVVIGDHLYLSKQVEGANGAMSYAWAERQSWNEETKSELLGGVQVTATQIGTQIGTQRTRTNPYQPV